MLNSRQRSFLKTLASEMEPITQIGKNGITEPVLEEIRIALLKRELVKVSVLNNSEFNAKTALVSICQAIKAEPVCAIGGKVILYKHSPREDIRHITFPKPQKEKKNNKDGVKNKGNLKVQAKKSTKPKSKYDPKNKVDAN